MGRESNGPIMVVLGTRPEIVKLAHIITKILGDERRRRAHRPALRPRPVRLVLRATQPAGAGGVSRDRRRVAGARSASR